MGQLIKNGINYTGGTGIIDNVGSTSPSLALSANQGHALANNMGAIEIGDTASQNYAIGNYFVWKSQFVRATKAISAGDTILITGANANVESTNIGSVLTELNTNLILKQNITDMTLTTASKVVPGAINEVKNSIGCLISTPPTPLSLLNLYESNPDASGKEIRYWIGTSDEITDYPVDLPLLSYIIARVTRYGSTCVIELCSCSGNAYVAMVNGQIVDSYYVSSRISQCIHKYTSISIAPGSVSFVGFTASQLGLKYIYNVICTLDSNTDPTSTDTAYKPRVTSYHYNDLFGVIVSNASSSTYSTNLFMTYFGQ